MSRFWRAVRPLRRLVAGLAIVLVPILLLAGIGWGVVYVRLANGPVSLSYLKPAIERQIAAKLGGLRVSVSDVVLSLVGQGAEFRLTDVQVRDTANKVVAQAPLAAMQIDRLALFRGEVSPTGIVLIRPEMRLSYSEREGLSLSFARQADARQRDDGQSAVTTDADGARVAVSAAGADATQAATNEREKSAGQITILRSIARLLAGMRSGSQAGLALDRIGVRNALIEIDYAGRISRWGVPSGDLEIKHLADRSVLSGLTTISASQGENIVLSFDAQSASATGQVTLKTAVRGLKPAAILRIAPSIGGLEALDTALSGEALFNLSREGDVVDGRATVEFGDGQIDLRSLGDLVPVRLDHGRLAMRFEANSDTIMIEPSTIGWGGGSELTVSGLLSPFFEANGDRAWRYQLTGQRGVFLRGAGDDNRQSLSAWSMAGHANPTGGIFQIDEGLVAVGGSSVVFDGHFGDEGGGSDKDFRINGRIGPTPISALGYFWPSVLAQDARRWVASQISGGQLTGGRFAVSSLRRGGADKPELWTQSVSLEGTDVRLQAPVGDLPLYAAKALVQLNGNQLEVSVPAAAVQLANKRTLGLKQVRFTVPDVALNDAVGALEFKVAGDLRDGAAVLGASPNATAFISDALSKLEGAATGRIEGHVNIALPLDPPANWRPEVAGRLTVRDVGMRNAVGSHDLSGGSFELDLAAKSINAKGEMLVDGVAAKLAWQYILDAPFESQPPIRIDTRLDERDRQKLGIQINHIVRGLLDVQINVIPLKGGGFGSKVRADATKAAIAVTSLAWVKPAGRRLQIEFDVVTKKKEVLFDNLRAVGDGIAIQGRATLDAKYNLKAFELPQFSIDRVTRLEMRGKLAKPRLWDVVVAGQTFEGRALFRSLFQAGRVAEAEPVPGAQQMGVDLTANIKTVLGFWNTKLSDVRMTLSKRQGKIQAMNLTGELANGKVFRAAILKGTQGARELHSFSDDAGQAFTLVGFYPNARRGRLELVVNLDGQGRAEKSGVLLVRDFRIRGDEVVEELARAPRDGIRRKRTRRQSGSGSQSLDFDWMRVPFFVGNGQFILQGAELRGPVVGATILGKADFAARTLDLSGTYVPLQGLNGALGVIPGLGQILAGPNGEGVLGMKFAVRGDMSRPEMLVNPLSLMAPGIFREMFQISNPSLEVTNRGTAAPVQSRQGPAGRAGKPRNRNNWRRGAFEAN